MPFLRVWKARRSEHEKRDCLSETPQASSKLLHTSILERHIYGDASFERRAQDTTPAHCSLWVICFRGGRFKAATSGATARFAILRATGGVGQAMVEAGLHDAEHQWV